MVAKIEGAPTNESKSAWRRNRLFTAWGGSDGAAMKKRLIDVDSHDSTNLALMKLPPWRKERGDTAEKREVKGNE